MMGPSYPSSRSSIRCACWIIPALLLCPGVAQAQGEAECDVPSHGGLVMTTLSSLSGESRLLEFKFPVIRCPGGVTIRADSARVYEATNYNQLFGNVVFSDQDSRLTANNAQYFADQRRLTASENTVLTDLTNGSIIRGDNMTLLRAGPGQAEDYLVVAGRRPHATLYPTVKEEQDTLVPDSALAPPDTTALPPDSALAPPDTTALPPDSAV
ncbi:MAG: hypothetical protein PVJ76_10455, partial [Gemmatimonadota bacterium]